MTNFDIKITSDTVCPWCYVGLRRLQKGISLFVERQAATPGPPHTFTLSWHPFYLDPDAPSPSIPKAQAYRAKFGPDRAKQIVANLTAAGDNDGIAFSFLGNTGRTRDSHRLLAWAATLPQADAGPAEPRGAAAGEAVSDPARAAGAAAAASVLATPQSRLVEELFAGYFEREEDITERAVLVRAAERAGLPAGEARRVLEADGGADELGPQVDAEAERARREEGISGAPHFVVNGRFEISGAQEPAAFAQILGRVATLDARAEL